MKNDLTCEVVQDLLPSYADGLTSPVTGEAVEWHLENCAQCTHALEEMLAPAEVTPVKQREVNYLRRGQRQVVCRCIVLALTAVYLAALLWLFFLRRSTATVLRPNLGLLGHSERAGAAVLDEQGVGFGGHLLAQLFPVGGVQDDLLPAGAGGGNGQTGQQRGVIRLGHGQQLAERQREGLVQHLLLGGKVHLAGLHLGGGD